MDDLREPETNNTTASIEGYRDTELDPIPEEWRLSQLGTVATKTFGGGTPSTKKAEFWDGSIPWTTTAVIGEDDTYLKRFQRGITEEGLQNSSAQVAPEYSVLVGTRVGVGKAVVTPFEVAIDQDITVVVPGPASIPEFLVLLMKTPSIQRWFLNNKRGTTIKGVPRKDVLDLKIALPPLPEQKAIAHVLRTVQKAIETTEQVIESTRELKRSLMNHLFTYGPVSMDEAEEVTLKETEIGLVPEHWDMVEFGELVQPRKENVNPEDAPELRYVGLEHVDSGEVAIERWGQADQIRSAKNRFYPHDLLYGKLRPYLDKAALAEWDGMSSTDILVLVPTDRAVVGYITYLVHTNFFLKRAMATTTGVNHPRTSWNSLSTFDVPLPPSSEQNEIAEILRTLDKKVAGEARRKQSLETLFKTLLHNLMTGKVRVKDLDLSEIEEMV